MITNHLSSRWAILPYGNIGCLWQVCAMLAMHSSCLSVVIPGWYSSLNSTKSFVHSSWLGSCCIVSRILWEIFEKKINIFFCLPQEAICFREEFQSLTSKMISNFAAVLGQTFEGSSGMTRHPPSALLNQTKEQMATDLQLQSGSACLNFILFVKIIFSTFKYISVRPFA